MNIEAYNLDSLRKLVRNLQKENKELRLLLDKAEIPYTNSEVFVEIPSEAEEYELDQGARIADQYINEYLVQKFFSMFWGRMDVFAKRAKNGNYYPQCDNRWDNTKCPKQRNEKIYCEDCEYQCWTKLTLKAIEKHLLGYREDGADVIGVYPLLPDGTCRFLLLDKGATTINLKTFRYYDRMYPSQDVANSIGNLIALPLQGQALKAGNSAFVDDYWNAYPNQWDKLFRTKKLEREEVEEYIAKWQTDFSNRLNRSDYTKEKIRLKPWKRQDGFSNKNWKS